MKRNLAIVATVMLVCTGIWWVKAAENPSSIVGTWRVTSFTYLTLDTNEISHPFGENLIGYFQFSPGGHLVLFISAGNPPKPASYPPTDAERAAILKGMIGAYAGTYSVEGNKVTYHLVASWRPEWIGTDLVRYFEINGNKLTIKSEPMISQLTGKRVVNTLTFERVE